MVTINHPKKEQYLVYCKDMYIKKSTIFPNAFTWLVMGKYNNIPLIIDFAGTYIMAKKILKSFGIWSNVVYIVRDDNFLAGRMPGGYEYKTFFKD